jgi:hypothetical protein
MDEMNPWENPLQSWTPRRPSPEIARRLFGQAAKPSLSPARRAQAWHWLSPAAACALTMLAAVHTSNRAPARLSPDSNTAFLASLMLNAAAPSHVAGYLDENIWTRATHRLSALPCADTPPRQNVWSLIPTNH